MSTDVYRDGIEAERCVTCRQMLRLKGGAATVPIRVADAEAVLCLLVEYVDCPEVCGDTIHRLEEVLGQSYAQLKRDLAQRHPAERDSRLDV